MTAKMYDYIKMMYTLVRMDLIIGNRVMFFGIKVARATALLTWLYIVTLDPFFMQISNFDLNCFEILCHGDVTSQKS